ISRLPEDVSSTSETGTAMRAAFHGQPDAAIRRAVCATRASWLVTKSRRPSIGRSVSADSANAKSSPRRESDRRELTSGKAGALEGAALSGIVWAKTADDTSYASIVISQASQAQILRRRFVRRRC